MLQVISFGAATNTNNIDPDIADQIRTAASPPEETKPMSTGVKVAIGASVVVGVFVILGAVRGG